MNTAEFHAPERYEKIERNNDMSWYFTEERQFEAYMSVGTVKPSARKFGEHALRQTLAGNMSPIYGPEDEALDNMSRFHEELGLDPAKTRILLPQRQYDIPLQMLNVDNDPAISDGEHPAILSERADFLYTYDSEIALAARPADCPIVLATAETPKGNILMLTHLAWQGAANGFVGQMFEHYETLGVRKDSLRIYVTPGGQAESFPYRSDHNPYEKYPDTHGLFANVTKVDDKYSYAIDTPNFVYNELLKYGVLPEQIYANTSDTSRADSGYSSHGRASRSNGAETNIRDIIIAKMNNGQA